MFTTNCIVMVTMVRKCGYYGSKTKIDIDKSFEENITLLWLSQKTARDLTPDQCLDEQQWWTETHSDEWIGL